MNQHEDLKLQVVKIHFSTILYRRQLDANGDIHKLIDKSHDETYTKKSAIALCREVFQLSEINLKYNYDILSQFMYLQTA